MASVAFALNTRVASVRYKYEHLQNVSSHLKISIVQGTNSQFLSKHEFLCGAGAGAGATNALSREHGGFVW